MKITKIWDTPKKNDYLYFNDILDFIIYIYGNNISLNFYFEEIDDDFISLVNDSKMNTDISKIPGVDEFDEIEDFTIDDDETIYTDYNHPLAINKNNKEVIINKPFFEKNKQLFINFFQAIVMDEIRNQKADIVIPDFAIDTNFINQINTNRYFSLSIKNVMNDELTKEELDAIKKVSYIVINNGEEVNDSSYYHDADKTIVINIPFNLSNLNFLTQLDSNMNIYFDSTYFVFEEEDIYSNLKTVLDVLAKTGKNYNVFVPINRRQLFNDMHVLKNITSNINVTIIADGLDYTLDEYLEEDTILEELVDPIRSLNLSPFENFVAVFNLVKNFKKYKDSPDDPLQARSLKYIFDSEYMVCAGYESLLRALLNKLNIPAMSEQTQVDDSYKNTPVTLEKPTEFSYHVRTIVKIKDDKYNINGIFSSDSTWDNDEKMDLYNYILMTFKEKKCAISMEKLNTYDLLLDCSSWDEFCDKKNYFLKNYAEKLSSSNEDNPKNYAILGFIVNVMDLLNILDKDVYNEFYNKYYTKLVIKTDKLGKSGLEIQENEDLLNEFYRAYYEYIKDVNNNAISKKKLYSAIFNVKKAVTGMENWRVRRDIKVVKMINDIMKEENFPYEISNDGYNDHIWNKKRR